MALSVRRIEVKAPPLEGPRPYGLFSYVTWLNDMEGEADASEPASGSAVGGGDRWIGGGITYRQAPVDGTAELLNTWDQGVTSTKVKSTMPGWVSKDPVTLYRLLKGSTGDLTLAELKASLSETFDQESQRYVESYWYSDMSVHGTVVTPGASSGWPDITGAIAELDAEWSARTGTMPTLHIPAFAAYHTEKCAATMLAAVDGKIFTRFGMPVVLGSGYTNLNASGADMGDGAISIHMTGPVFGLRSSEFRPAQGYEGVDTSLNDVQAVMEQSFVLGTTYSETLTAYANVC